jgi:hypothetical protein
VNEHKSEDHVSTTCVCGHPRADHKHEKYPLSTECFADDCECSRFRDVREALDEAREEHLHG